MVTFHETTKQSPTFEVNYNTGPETPNDPNNFSVYRRPFTNIATDPMQDDKATEIKLLSLQRPHMRAFHFAWLSFFIAFFGWFSIPPLMPTIKKQLHLTADQVANSNIVSVSSTILGRTIAGPLCDRYGSRSVQAVLLIVGAIPVASAALVTNYTGFMLVRFFIGLVGCSFVATAYWTSVMFSKQVVGSANALAAGWGNLGAGATYLITPFLFDLVTINGTVSDSMGWRITLLFPAVFMIVVGVCLYLYSDDCPQGNYAQLRKMEELAASSPSSTSTTTTRFVTRPMQKKMDMKKALLEVVKMPVTWILAFQYACSFGVELQVHNVLSLYYYEDFTKSAADGCFVATDANKCRMLTQTKASLISSLFGLMCIFARAAGGFASDFASSRYEMKGRIGVQFLAFAGQAIFLFAYSRLTSLSWSIPCLVVFGIFVQACTGSTYGIVPYVAPKLTGATSGLVGAGGNVGGLAWGFLFKGVVNRRKSFEYLSAFVAVAALLSAGIQITGERTVWTKDNSVHGSTAATECGDEEDGNMEGADDSDFESDAKLKQLFQSPTSRKY